MVGDEELAALVDEIPNDNPFLDLLLHWSSRDKGFGPW